jgi:hypothetical protein
MKTYIALVKDDGLVNMAVRQKHTVGMARP